MFFDYNINIYRSNEKHINIFQSNYVYFNWWYYCSQIKCIFNRTNEIIVNEIVLQPNENFISVKLHIYIFQPNEKYISVKLYIYILQLMKYILQPNKKHFQPNFNIYYSLIKKIFLLSYIYISAIWYYSSQISQIK